MQKMSKQVMVPSLNNNTNSTLNLKLEKVNQELGAKIVKIAHKYRSEGIPIDSIKHLFHKQFLCELNAQELGFESTDELISAVLADNYPIEIRTDSQGFRRLYSDLNKYFYWLSVLKVKQKFELLNILVDVPEDVISCGQQLPIFEFPGSVEFNSFPEILSGDILNNLKYTEVRIMSVISPHEMYLQICGDNYHNSYHKLRTDMRFYDKKENSDKYRIPSLLLLEGLLCAAKYSDVCNEWHRTRILSIDKEDNVTLELLDIGTTITEKANELRLLKKEFVLLAPQAIKVQLTAIRPFGKITQLWSNSAKSCVKRLREYNYCGKIECAFIDDRSDRFRVFIKFYDRLRSKNIDDLVFLHQLLVDKQLALISGHDSVIN